MNKTKESKRSAKKSTPSKNGLRNGRIAAAGLAIVILCACGFLWSKGTKTGGEAVAAAPTESQTLNGPGTAAMQTSPDLSKLTGKWVRSDGGYVLEIKSVGSGGKMDAAYFNPQPINVSRAEATRENGSVKVFVELRAPNYPGSTYSLKYDAETDQLKGIYYQAALKQEYEVFFERMK
jgi:hypothetical protein